MKKEVPPFGVLAADYDPNTHVIVARSSVTTSARRPDAAQNSSKNTAATTVNTAVSGTEHGSSDARASLDRAKKKMLNDGKSAMTLNNDVHIFDQKKQSTVSALKLKRADRTEEAVMKK